MELLKLEGTSAEGINQEQDEKICELSELQLSLVGGGSGDVVFH